MANPLDDLPKDRLKALEDRIASRKPKAEDSPHQKKDYAMANLAWRMVIELVAGLGIGFGIGYGLDVLLGTKPLLMVVFALLGIAAGINVMRRTAKEVQAKQGSGPQSGTGPERAKADRPDGGTNDSARLTGADEGKRDGD